jgi:cytochrome c5
MIKLLATALTSVALLAAFNVRAEDKAAANTAPVGQVCKAGDACAAAPVAAAGGAAKTGEQVFTTTCTSCHSTGAAGAPKVGDAAAWTPRLTERGGKDGMYKSAMGGFKGMPAKGLCFACSEDEIKGAVDYMLSKVGK